VQDGALAGAVGTEEQRQRREVDALPGGNALEVLDLERGQHGDSSEPEKARATSELKSCSAS
jgi:hypothetical protein